MRKTTTTMLGLIGMAASTKLLREKTETKNLSIHLPINIVISQNHTVDSQNHTVVSRNHDDNQRMDEEI